MNSEVSKAWRINENFRDVQLDKTPKKIFFYNRKLEKKCNIEQDSKNIRSCKNVCQTFSKNTKRSFDGLK